MQWYWYVIIIGGFCALCIYAMKKDTEEMQPIFDWGDKLIGCIRSCETFEQWEKCHVLVQKFQLKYPYVLGYITQMNHELLLKAQKLAKTNV